MPRTPLEIATGFYQSESLPLSAQRCVNWIPVVPQTSGLSQRALFPAEGLTSFASLTGTNRGAQVVNGLPYFVNGRSLYSITAGGVSTNHGSIAGGGRVSLANNGQHLVIVVPGAEGYSYDTTVGTLTQITDPDYRPSSTVVFKDGYFVFTASAGDVFFNSSLNNPLEFSGLDFGSAEISPDSIVAAHVNHNELFVLGTETIELFQNVGGAGFPFQRIAGANIQKGVRAPFSIVEFDNTFLFVGGGVNEKSSIWRVSGSSSANKVSTSAIDAAIQEFTDNEIADAFGFTYASGGSFFAGFTFTSNRIPSRTFVYDATTSALAGEATWHERQSGIDEDRWRVASIIQAYGELLVGDSIDGTIGKIDKTVYTEYGNRVLHEKVSQPFFADNLPVFEGDLVLTMESGVGLQTGQGSDPQIMMDYSDDGGRTYSSEQWRSYGKIGEYNSLPTWRRQGRIPRHRVIRFRTTEPVKNVLLKLDANIEQGFQ